jgi:protein-tyrosine-phosphatase
MPEKIVLFICVENACRSLMAEAIFNANPPPGWSAVSAGTRPALFPNARTGPMLQELDLSLPRHPPQLLTEELAGAASIRVTMGCLDDTSCPAHLKTFELRDWKLPDPAKLPDDQFRAIRDELKQRVDELSLELAPSREAMPSGSRSSPP